MIEMIEMNKKNSFQKVALFIWFQINKITIKVGVPLSWIEDNRIDEYLKELIQKSSSFGGFILSLWWEINWIQKYEGNAYSDLDDNSIERLFVEVINDTRKINAQRDRRRRGEHNYDGECDYCGKFSFLVKCEECTGLLCEYCMKDHICNKDIMSIAFKDLTKEGIEKYNFLMKKLGKKGCPLYQINTIIRSIERGKPKIFIKNKSILSLDMPTLIQFLKQYNLNNEEIAFFFS
jgi:hypothetical protein